MKKGYENKAIKPDDLKHIEKKKFGPGEVSKLTRVRPGKVGRITTKGTRPA